MKYQDLEVIREHPFGTYIPKGSKFLVIGTFPTHPRNYKSTFEFFYAGVDNQFWPVMEQIFKKFDFNSGDKAVEERKKFLNKQGIGLTDMLTKCYRYKERSQDQYIFPIKFNNIFALLDTHETIETIILTSRTKVIGALGLFETYFYLNDIEPPQLRVIDSNRKILEGNFKWRNRDIEVLVPYSTSATVIEERRTNLQELVTMYKCCLK